MALTVLCILVTLMSICGWGNVEALAMSEVNGPGPLVAEPQIAMFCGRQILHMNPENGQWEPDPQGRQGCFNDPGQILSYCQEMYPTLQISRVEESSSPVTIPAWCKKGWHHCQIRPFIVLPYRCLVGEYVSEALLVTDRCRFLHQEQMDACESHVYWHNIAKEVRPVQLTAWSCIATGCCCHAETSFGAWSTSAAQAGGSGARGDADVGDGPQGGAQTLAPLADAKASAGTKVTPLPRAPPRTPTRRRPRSRGRGREGAQTSRSPPRPLPKPGDSLPTPRPTDGVDVYFEMPGEDSEHANFLRAKMDLEERRMKRINEIMKEWAEADNQSKNLPKSDRQALNEHFQSVLQTLEEQVAGERQRLVETHLARVVATLNNNRRLALESYLTAVQSEPPQPERVLQALKRYMAAEQKDRRHTLRHYQHIQAVDPQKAQQMKFQVYTHLHVIEERMNQSLGLLYKVPDLAEELHQEIRTGAGERGEGDISELMTTSFSETRTTEELLPAESEEEKDDEEEEERAFQNRPYPPRIDSQPNSKKGPGIDEYDYATAEYEEKLNTSVELKQVVYKSPGIQRDELQPDALETFNRGAMVGLLVVAVAIAMVMVISLLLVRRKPYGTISHGIVEQVDPMLTPEERQLNKMQNHGYENPTYKFFEQMN
ncbi:hypothetical protein ANANG_G00000530 [Anguilla anguilla]|uniref:Amyloid-like protein 1 n=1 Tax=Anguilla anguilla TaxID=7936 RepID=A0A9D3S5S3_ANGAN|nr:hypothetical protein ANANG_G00000530 [Anguilla anguilla]